MVGVTRRTPLYDNIRREHLAALVTNELLVEGLFTNRYFVAGFPVISVFDFIVPLLEPLGIWVVDVHVTRTTGWNEIIEVVIRGVTVDVVYFDILPGAAKVALAIGLTECSFSLRLREGPVTHAFRGVD